MLAVFLFLCFLYQVVSQEELPPLLSPINDPVYGTRLQRFTDVSRNGGFGTHTYSQLQAFSNNNRFVLLIENGAYIVRRVSDRALVLGPNQSQAWNAPRWHPARNDVIVHFDSNEDTILRIQFTNIETGDVDTIFTFPSRYERIFTSRSHDELSDDDEKELSFKEYNIKKDSLLEFCIS